jgi:hypothetical protein
MCASSLGQDLNWKSWSSETFTTGRPCNVEEIHQGRPCNGPSSSWAYAVHCSIVWTSPYTLGNYHKVRGLVCSQSAAAKPWDSILLTGNLLLVSFQVYTGSCSTLEIGCRMIAHKKKHSETSLEAIFRSKALMAPIVGTRYDSCKSRSNRDADYRFWSNEEDPYRQLQHAFFFVLSISHDDYRPGQRHDIVPKTWISGMVLRPADCMAPCQDKLNSFEPIGWFSYMKPLQSEHQKPDGVRTKFLID